MLFMDILPTYSEDEKMLLWGVGVRGLDEKGKGIEKWRVVGTK